MINMIYYDGFVMIFDFHDFLIVMINMIFYDGFFLIVIFVVEPFVISLYYFDGLPRNSRDLWILVIGCCECSRKICRYW